MRRLGLIMLVVATLHGVASAQETTGTITGLTTDETGGLLPGVTVTVRNTGTALARTIVTNETGSYTAPLLPIASYEVVFDLQGFQTVTQRNITCTSTIGCRSTAG
jgi:hypothetical protein